MLPPLEIRTGLKEIVAEQIGVRPPDAVAALARMFGFARTGKDFEGVVDAQLRSMLGDETLELRNGNKLYLPGIANAPTAIDVQE